MSKFRKKQIVDAFQWFKHGDVEWVVGIPLDQKCPPTRREKVGWLETPEGGHLIFAGDWILIDSKGNLSSCNPITFTRLYEAAETYELPKRSRDKSI